MNSKPDTGEVREARGKAVEIAALWERWKTKKQFSTVPTSLGKLSAKSTRRVFHSSHSFGSYFLSKKETGEKRRGPTSHKRNWVACGRLRVPGSRLANNKYKSPPARGEFFLDFPFHRTGLLMLSLDLCSGDSATAVCLLSKSPSLVA